MKKFSLSIFFLLIANICLADQLAYITLSQAKEAQAYLLTTDHIIIWCACCENDVAEMITTDNVYYKKVNYKDFYQVVVEGKNKNGKYVSRDLDLAYVHSLENGFYKAVGKILNYKCDTCTQPFQLSSDSKSLNNPDQSMKFITIDASTNGVVTTPTLIEKDVKNEAENVSFFGSYSSTKIIVYTYNVESKKFEKTNTINEKSELFLGDKYYGISRGDIKEWVWREWSQSNSSKDNKPLFFDNFGNTIKMDFNKNILLIFKERKGSNWHKLYMLVDLRKDNNIKPKY